MWKCVRSACRCWGAGRACAATRGWADSTTTRSSAPAARTDSPSSPTAAPCSRVSGFPLRTPDPAQDVVSLGRVIIRQMSRWTSAGTRRGGSSRCGRWARWTTSASPPTTASSRAPTSPSCSRRTPRRTTASISSCESSDPATECHFDIPLRTPPRRPLRPNAQRQHTRTLNVILYIQR